MKKTPVMITRAVYEQLKRDPIPIFAQGAPIALRNGVLKIIDDNVEVKKCKQD